MIMKIIRNSIAFLSSILLAASTSISTYCQTSNHFPIEDAIQTKSIQKYHFILLRNLYEKTASFLGYPQWSDLLPDDKLTYYNRIIQFTSHSTLSNEAIAEPTDPEKKTLELLFNHLVGNKYWKERQQE